MSADLPAGVLLRAATAADQTHAQRLLMMGGLSGQRVAAHVGKSFIAEASDEVMAAISLEYFGGDALLRWVYVDPAWRGQGVATNIVEHVLTSAVLDAIDAVYVLSGATERFFARFGFVRVQRADLPFTIARAMEGASGYSDSGTSMHLRLSEP